jgi:hypothetical protein
MPVLSDVGRTQKFYLARFAPFEFFVLFVVNCLEFVLRVSFENTEREDGL